MSAVRINCPLCNWVMDAEAPDVGPGAFAGIFGIGVMRAVALSEHFQATERQLREHLETHSLVEWVRKVTELEDLVAGMTAEFGRLQGMPSLREMAP